MRQANTDKFQSLSFLVVYNEWCHLHILYFVCVSEKLTGIKVLFYEYKFDQSLCEKYPGQFARHNQFFGFCVTS